MWSTNGRPTGVAPRWIASIPVSVLGREHRVWPSPDPRTRVTDLGQYLPGNR
jgi:hypothetical protein